MLEWTLTSSVLILAVLTIRFGFRKRLSMRVCYALWLAVALRLLIPVTFSESVFSVLNLLPENRETVQVNGAAGGQMAGPAADRGVESGQTFDGMAGIPEVPGIFGMSDIPEMADMLEMAGIPGMSGGPEIAGIPDMPEIPGDILEGNSPMSDKNTGTGASRADMNLLHFTQDADHADLGEGNDSSKISGLFRQIWLAGVVIVGLMIAAMNLCLMMRLRRSRRMLDLKPLESLPVYVSGAVETPCLFGVLRPVIYLVPEAIESSDGLHYVLQHENVHYRHRDNIWSLVRAVCLCLHWYNPLVWLAASRSRQDGELACDEDTIRQLGEQERLDYGRKLLEFCARGRMPLSGFTLATTMSGGKRKLRERLQMIAQQPKKTAGAVVTALLLVALVLAVTFTGRQVVQQAEPLQANAATEENSDGQEPGEQESKNDDAQDHTSEDEDEESAAGIFGYQDYTGYLDECLQWGDARNDFTNQDYDRDGLTDRVWRENIEDWAVANYRIEFGNGDVIQMDGLGGGMPQVRSADLTGDGVPEILFTQSYGYSTDPTAFGEVALFEKTPDGYRQMELPGGMIKEPKDHVDFYLYTETQYLYCPTLTYHIEHAGGHSLQITCLETAQDTPLDVIVDIDEDTWNSGCYDEYYWSEDIEHPIWLMQIEERENELPRLKLYTAVLDKWCADSVILTLVYRDGALQMEDAEYYHYYDEVLVPIDLGDRESYSLEMAGGTLIGSGMYQLNHVRLWHYLDQDQSQRELIGTVDLAAGGARDQWNSGNRPVSFSPDSGVLVDDLNFDGAQDICLKMWAEGRGMFYYCYVWDSSAREFVYIGTLSDEEGQQLACSAQMGQVSVTGYYYVGENGWIVLDRFEMKDDSPGALFETLELTYRQLSYSMPAIKDYDYGIYNGKEQADLVYWAVQALKELHRWTGIKVESAYFTMTSFGDVFFARTEADLMAGRIFYSRRYGAEAGFWDCIQGLDLATARTVWYSPVQIQLFPDNMNRMSSEEIVSWYFEKWAEEDGEKVADIEKILEDTFVIRAESGNYYEVIYNQEMVSGITGPYSDYPQH